MFLKLLPASERKETLKFMAKLYRSAIHFKRYLSGIVLPIFVKLDQEGLCMESFKCVLTNWDYIYNLCRKISLDIKNSGYEPDVIIALARGGWFAGRVLCDFLGLDDLSSLKIEHYVGTAAIDSGEPYIKYPLSVR